MLPLPSRQTPITRQLTATSRLAMSPNCSSARRATAGVVHSAIRTPPAVPIATSAADSKSSCRAISARVAPSALRTASSRRRSIVRTSSNPARLVNAISIARTTAPPRRPSVPVAPPAIAVVIGVAIARAGGERCAADIVQRRGDCRRGERPREARDRPHAVSLANRRRRRHRKRAPDVTGAEREEESLRQDADDRVRPAPEHDLYGRSLLVRRRACRARTRG